MQQPPGGLVAGQRRPRRLRLVRGADWYVVDRERFELVGSGDLAMSDLAAVEAELRSTERSLGVFVCVSRPKEIEDVLGAGASWGTKRITWSARIAKPIAPSLAAVARGARLALLPIKGAVWVDGENLFTPGERVPLPWTDPLVALEVVRPKALLRVLRAALGGSGPRRAQLGGS
ncbi:MAG: hypothetical protein ACYCSF_07760 [Acidimicrobiales bacterium]